VCSSPGVALLVVVDAHGRAAFVAPGESAEHVLSGAAGRSAAEVEQAAGWAVGLAVRLAARLGWPGRLEWTADEVPGLGWVCRPRGLGGALAVAVAGSGAHDVLRPGRSEVELLVELAGGRQAAG